MNEKEATIKYFKRLAVDFAAGKLPRHGNLYLIEMGDNPAANTLMNWFSDWEIHHVRNTYSEEQSRGLYIPVEECMACSLWYLLRCRGAAHTIIVFEPRFAPFAKKGFHRVMLLPDQLAEYADFCLGLGSPDLADPSEVRPLNSDRRLGQAATLSLRKNFSLVPELTDMIYEILEIDNDWVEIPEIDELVSLVIEVFAEQVKYRGGLDTYDLCLESIDFIGRLYSRYRDMRESPVPAIRNAVALFKARIDPEILG